MTVTFFFNSSDFSLNKSLIKKKKQTIFLNTHVKSRVLHNEFANDQHDRILVNILDHVLVVGGDKRLVIIFDELVVVASIRRNPGQGGGSRNRFDERNGGKNRSHFFI